MPKCHFVFVRIFWRNRKWWAMHGRVLVNNIYIYVQTGSFFWITRPLLHQKQAVSDLETTLFFYWNNGFFVLIGTKNIAHIAFIRRNALCRRALRLHTKTARFCGRMILISEYFSMRTSALIFFHYVILSLHMLTQAENVRDDIFSLAMLDVCKYFFLAWCLHFPVFKAKKYISDTKTFYWEKVPD